MISSPVLFQVFENRANDRVARDRSRRARFSTAELHQRIVMGQQLLD